MFDHDTGPNAYLVFDHLGIRHPPATDYFHAKLVGFLHRLVMFQWFPRIIPD